MDDLETQTKFARSLELPFPLLADPEGKIARAYGVAGDGYAKRVTFIIDTDGRVLEVLEGPNALDPTAALAAAKKAGDEV